MKGFFKTISIFAVLMVAASAFSVAFAQQDPAVSGLAIIHEEEFGGVYAEITIDAFCDLGFSFGDSLIVSFSNGYVLEDIPFYNGYYTLPGEPLVVGYPGYPYIDICVNYGDDLWQIAGLSESDTVDISLLEKQAYLDIQETRNISYKDDRNLYPDDITFANFRSVKAGNIAEGALYRSASPCDNSHLRAPYVDELCKEANIRCIFDLADTPEKIQGYIEKDDFASTYFLSLFEEGHVLPIALNMNIPSEEFRTKLATGLSDLALQETPYLVHCTEGKDRTGFVCMLLEALCGASYQEIVDDYMITYANYYGITKESDPDRYTVIVERMLNPMILNLGFPEAKTPDFQEADLSQYARDFLLKAGMEEETVSLLIERLTSEPEIVKR